MDNAIKVCFAVDIFRKAIEKQEECRNLPEYNSRQLDLKINELTKADELLANIKEEISKLK